MRNVMEYKGYRGTVVYEPDDEMYHGRLAGISDTIIYEGNTVEELETDFREAVEDYLETCKEIGKEPERPYSGRLVLSVSSELHASLAELAGRSGKNINEFIEELCERAVGGVAEPSEKYLNGQR